MVRGYRSALAATLPAAERAFAQRYLRWDWDEDGSLRLEARLPADDGALLLAALNAAARRADALVSLGRSGLATGGDQAPALGDQSHTGGASVRAGGDPCEVVVHVDADTLAADQVHSRAELSNVPVQPACGFDDPTGSRFPPSLRTRRPEGRPWPSAIGVAG